jgi:hypothetical protein
VFALVPESETAGTPSGAETVTDVEVVPAAPSSSVTVSVTV